MGVNVGVNVGAKRMGVKAPVLTSMRSRPHSLIQVSDLGENGRKGQKRLAQGSALGIDYQRLCALKGQKRVMHSNAFALSARILATSLTQGVALG